MHYEPLLYADVIKILGRQKMDKREIKFRLWADNLKVLYTPEMDSEMKNLWHIGMLVGGKMKVDAGDVVMQFTGYKDMKGVEIYEGDILRFTDKWEWYRGSYAIKMMAADGDRLRELKEQYAAEPFEDRIVDNMREEWLNSSEIQTYWEIIGNIYENPELVEP